MSTLGVVPQALFLSKVTYTLDFWREGLSLAWRSLEGSDAWLANPRDQLV